MKRLAAWLSAILLAMLSVMPLATATAAGSNLIANPGFETASGTKPASWSQGSWGTNKPTFTYATTGHTGSRAATVKMASYSNGDAKWYANPVTAAANTTYTYSDWYQSTVASEVDAVYTSTTGAVTYAYLGTPAASSTWKQSSYSFTTPANVKNITFYHVIAANGTLSIDDVSLTNNTDTTPAPTAPTVSLTAPAANATVSGTQTITATATDAIGLSSVQFKLDGANLGAADTSAPFSASWDTKTIANGTHTLTAVATNTSNLSTTSTPVTVTVNNVAAPTAPTVSITAPSANATVNGTVNVTANASDAVAVTSVQFKLDGVNLGSADTTAPYSTAWDTKTATNGTHVLTAVATNGANLSTTSTSVNVTVNNVVAPTAPTVSLTAPAASATVSGTQTVTANAYDAVSVSSVQFKLDGNNLGSPDTTAPYSAAWDTKTATNGSHTLTAVATNNSNLSTTSAPVAVTVNNTVVTPPTGGANLVLNPSVETGAPDNWHSDGWGTNTHSFSFENTGHTGTHSVKTTMSAYTNGDAKWYFDDVAVTPGQAYQYSDWYQSNVDTEIDAQVTMADGSVQYFYLGTALASPAAWTQFKVDYTAPAGAKSIMIFQAIAKVGFVQVDDVSFGTYTPSQFNRAIVTLTFDDGWRSIYTNGLPLLNKYGLTSTQYLNSQPIVDGYPDYMTYQMVKDFAAAGHELGWHTRTHADITTLTAAKLNTELTIPANFLTGIGKTAADFKSFASPYGAYNASSVAAVMQKYQSHRSTDVGYNSKDNFAITNIKVQNITNTTTPADVAAWVAQAQATKTWLVIVYHEVDTAPEDATYAVTPANLDAELSGIKQSGVAVETVEQALNEIQPQL